MRNSGSRLQAWREAGFIFLLTRGALFLLAPLAYLTLPRVDPAYLSVPPKIDTALTNTMTGFGHYLFDIWARWDSVWYLEIAHHGYSATNGSAAFFPLYPLLIAVFKPAFGGNGVVAGILISLASCLVAFYLLFRLVEIDFGAGVARRAVLYLAVFPTSFYFQAIYSESLFLALTIGCIYLARRRQYLFAGALGLLATLTRSAGLVLILPLALMYMHDRGWNWRRIKGNWIFIMLVPLGLGIWMLYLYVKFGDPWLFSEAQSNWLRQVNALGPIGGLWNGIDAAFQGIKTILSSSDINYSPIDLDPRLWPANNVMNLAFTLPFLGLAVAAFRRLSPAYAAYGLASLLLPLSLPSAFVPLLSMPRFVLAAFPLFILLALWGEEKPWFDRLLMVLSLTFLGLLTAKFVVWTWVA
ncbi:MAG: glycosyltransferase family 39 protein [Actinobacteria bacterium]|nr:glycosyltransferase family 39 protein [Actinomycetota bacterium]